MPVSDKKDRMSESNSLSIAATISSIEDKSSILYEGRAWVSEIADIPGMEAGGWRDRLAAALKRSGKSKRSVSLKANLGPGYVHSILVEGKDPTIDNLASVCREIGVSLSYVLYGVEMTPETEAIVRELERGSPARRESFLQLLLDSRPPGPNASDDRKASPSSAKK